MAFAYTVTDQTVIGSKKLRWGTYTNGGSDTGGAISTGLSRVDGFYLQPKGTAVVASAAAVILMHSHPSGDPAPSDADIAVTRDLIRAGQLLKIEVLDHVIMGKPTQDRPQDFVSLRELGHFYN